MIIVSLSLSSLSLSLSSFVTLLDYLPPPSIMVQKNETEKDTETLSGVRRILLPTTWSPVSREEKHTVLGISLSGCLGFYNSTLSFKVQEDEEPKENIAN